MLKNAILDSKKVNFFVKPDEILTRFCYPIAMPRGSLLTRPMHSPAPAGKRTLPAGSRIRSGTPPAASASHTPSNPSTFREGPPTSAMKKRITFADMQPPSEGSTFRLGGVGALTGADSEPEATPPSLRRSLKDEMSGAGPPPPSLWLSRAGGSLPSYPQTSY